MVMYIFRRVLMTLPILFITISIVFFSLRILPGDAAITILGAGASQASLETLRESMGLNVPLWQQYINFLVSIVQGNFGTSLTTGQSVSEQLLGNSPNTFNLITLSIVIGCMLGIPFGILAALKRNSITDNIFRSFSMIGISTPSFLLGIFMIIIFSLNLSIFPSMGVGDGFVDGLYHLILPSLTLGIILAAEIMRYTRSSILDEIHKDYIRTARAKGAPGYLITFKHVLKNTLIPVVTIIGLNITVLIGGAVLIETVFSRPGLGSLALGALLSRDFPVLQGCLILFVFIVTVVNLLVDISYALINPKIKYN